MGEAAERTNSNQQIDEEQEDIKEVDDFIMFNTDDDDDLNNNDFESNIDEIYNNVSCIIQNEKNKIQKDKEVLMKKKKEFNDFKNKELTKLENDKMLLNEKMKMVSTTIKENDIIDLNIGGMCNITTTRSTLTKYKKSVLGILFGGYYTLVPKDGKYFIDRESGPFINLVNFLRTGKFPALKTKEEEVKFLDELDFWKIPLIDSKMNPNEFQFDPNWCAEVLTIEHNNTSVKKQNLQHGIVFVKQALDLYSPYIEFKVNINIPWKGKSHLFIGLVDKSKYKFEHLSSKYWKDSPSAYYWDVWNCQLIKTNENGVQIGSAKGYGCQCVETETYLAIMYDYKTRTVSFYKNGLCYGVAFKNVPNGLTPALDLWFESGTIQIVSNAIYQKQIYL